MRSFVSVVLSCSLMWAAAAAAQTLDPLAPKPPENQNGNALTNPGLSPEVEFLYQL
jgi:hypothetical protein